MEQFNITMRKYLNEVGVTAQQAIERVVREEKLAGKGKLKVKMVLTGKVPASGTWSKARSIWLTHMIPRRRASLGREAHSFFRLPLLPRLCRALIVVCPAELLSLSSLCVTWF